MRSDLLDKILRRPSGAFLHAARKRGLPARAARALEAAAREAAPDAPDSIFDSRELFERAAALAVLGDAGNLELSYHLVDLLATTVEKLDLARSSDVPDPFRRVWVENESGTTRRGVVLRCASGEVAVLCPPSGKSIADIGAPLRLRYRGFGSAVDYELRLNDAVRLPGAQVLHLTRLDGLGAIGRVHPRYQVSIEGRLETDDGFDDPCAVLDISAGGVRVKSEHSYEVGQCVRATLALDDGDEVPFATRCEVRWVADLPHGQALGLLFDELPEPLSERLSSHLRQLASEQEALPGPDAQ
jgi:hypothetical protein